MEVCDYCGEALGSRFYVIDGLRFHYYLCYELYEQDRDDGVKQLQLDFPDENLGDA